MRSTEPGSALRREPRGFTYIGLLVLIALIGIALAKASEVAATAARRDREQELLWVGHVYRDAIARYWVAKRSYPQKLEDLLGSDPDAPIKVRYIRRLYRDPMTNAVDWNLLPAPQGGIMGVASSSKRAPLKTAGFDEVDKGFGEAKDYGDWQFTFVPGVFRHRPR